MLKKLLKSIKPEYILIVVLLEIAAFTHSYNMFKFPYYENDEGTYMSQAWSLVTKGELAPYTYWYDHAPGGWMLIGTWSQVTGGFFNFGFSVNSGRVLMLVLHVLIAFFLYRITKKLSNSILASSIAVLLFSLSPLAIYFQRRVLLDNIMIFWLFFAMYIVVRQKLTLWKVVFSALLFAMAVLSKETAIVFAPGFLILLYSRLNKANRLFVMFEWLAVVGMAISVYVLYALLKGEFFPEGSILGGNQPHVSLIESLQFQMSRKASEGQFWHELVRWFNQDKFLIAAGFTSTLSMIFLSIKKRVYTAFVVMVASYTFFLARGGVLIEFYILPLIPFFGMFCGVVVNEFKNSVTELIGKVKIKNSITFAKLVAIGFNVFIFVSLLGYYYMFGQLNRGMNIYTANQTKSQIEAVKWIRENIQSDSIFIVDNYGYVDLKAKDNPSSKYFDNAEWYWKIDTDREIKSGKLKDDPNNIDIIALTPQTSHDISNGGSDFTFLNKALSNSSRVKVFWNDGWGVEFRATKFPPKEVLNNSWESYKDVFITKDGRTIDPKNNNDTTSVIQGYSLLRSVWMDDKVTFDSVWNWTNLNMKNSSGLFGSKWEAKSKALIEKGTTASADTDIALALVLASRKWNDATYLNSAREIAQNIWSKEVKYIAGKPFIVASDWLVGKKEAFVSLSTLSPHAYRQFAEIDTENDWNALVSTSYEVLEKCTTSKLDVTLTVALPPDWCAIDSAGAAIAVRDTTLGSSTYGFNANHAVWKVALDYSWSNDNRAQTYLSNLKFLRDEWTSNGKLAAIYSHDGKVVEAWESVTAYSGNLGGFVTTDFETARQIYSKKISAKYYQDDNGRAYWEDKDDVYTQNWAWFGTALYSENLANK
jgi:endo-1,4-beta-D-glucanase Y/4-amino-4-deoxy-L-arabinose transferase-like glycosyltransferase